MGLVTFGGILLLFGVNKTAPPRETPNYFSHSVNIGK